MADPHNISAGRGGSRTSFGFRDVPAADKQPMVDEVFASVAGRYDLMNDLMSGGMHRLWKRELVNWLSPPVTGSRPYRMLDLAGGTGDIAFRIANRAPAATVTVLDISKPMLDVGRERAEKRGLSSRVRFIEGNAEALPLDDDSFDAATIAFGIRNVPDIPAALAEAHRVLKIGGRFLVLEFSRVDVAGLEELYELYSFNVIPKLGGLVANDEDSYRYLVESIRRFPPQEQFADMVRAAGFARVSYRNLTGGIAAIHSGWKL